MLYICGLLEFFLSHKLWYWVYSFLLLFSSVFNFPSVHFSFYFLFVSFIFLRFFLESFSLRNIAHVYKKQKIKFLKLGFSFCSFFCWNFERKWIKSNNNLILKPVLSTNISNTLWNVEMSIFKKEIFFLFVVLGSYLTLVDCACQSLDASWEPDRGPLITQANFNQKSNTKLFIVIAENSNSFIQ